MTRDWYFETGGIYLSDASRPEYFHLKKLLEEVINDPELDKPGLVLGEERLQHIIQAGSDLRKSLQYDVGTRKNLLTTPRTEPNIE